MALSASTSPIVPVGGPSVPYPAKGRRVKGLQEIEPPRDEFSRVVSYRFYRLNHQSTRYAAEDARIVSRQVRAMRHSFHTTHFDGSDPIMVLSFFKSFRDAANNDGVSEGSAPRILPYFLQVSAAADLQSQLAEWERTRPSRYDRAWLHGF